MVKLEWGIHWSLNYNMQNMIHRNKPNNSSSSRYKLHECRRSKCYTIWLEWKHYIAPNRNYSIINLVWKLNQLRVILFFFFLFLLLQSQNKARIWPIFFGIRWFSLSATTVHWQCSFNWNKIFSNYGRNMKNLLWYIKTDIYHWKPTNQPRCTIFSPSVDLCR